VIDITRLPGFETYRARRARIIQTGVWAGAAAVMVAAVSALFLRGEFLMLAALGLLAALGVTLVSLLFASRCPTCHAWVGHFLRDDDEPAPTHCRACGAIL
jgi:hypothetical protein